LPAAPEWPLGLRDGVRKNIGIKHHNRANYCRERDRMPEHKAENASFRANLVVAAVAMQIDCASIILPITPPALLAEHISTGFR
jgi:hypothetical protein